MSANPTEVISDSILLRDDENGITTLTLNRPAQFNAFSSALIGELQNALDNISADDSIRVVIIAARGKAFCPGHDLNCGRTSEQRV